METAEAYRRAGDWTAAVFAGVKSDQMGNSTPCDDWDVRGLMNHVVGSNLFFAARARGDEVSGDPPDDFLGDDPAAAYLASVDAVAAGMATEGATERMINTRAGELPGSVIYSIAFTEQLLHGWDLAKATGQDTSLDPELVVQADAFSRPAVESGLAGDAYKSPISVPEDATPQAKLLALVGRTV